MDNARLRRRVRRTLLYALSVACFLSVFVVAEVWSKRALEARLETTYPLFFDRDAGPSVGPHTAILEYVDPLLGHAYAPDFLTEQLDAGRVVPGFVIHGDVYGDPLRIFVLGGSTSAPVPAKSWPEYLYQELDGRGVEAVVFNGGVPGYASTQELLKLMRDVLPHEPDVVISLSGINDVGHVGVKYGYPMVHRYQAELFETIASEPDPWPIFPNVSAFAQTVTRERTGIQGVNYGLRDRTMPAAYWERNVRWMRALAAASGVEYLCFRQPHLGVGAYTPGQRERNMLDDFDFTIFRDGRPITYSALLREFYENSQDVPETLPYCVDLVDVFNGRQGMYRDARHQTARGREVLAKAVVRELEARGFIQPQPLGP